MLFSLGALYQHRVYSQETRRGERCAVQSAGGDVRRRGGGFQADTLCILSSQGVQGEEHSVRDLKSFVPKRDKRQKSKL